VKEQELLMTLPEYRLLDTVTDEVLLVSSQHDGSSSPAARFSCFSLSLRRRRKNFFPGENFFIVENWSKV